MNESTEILILNKQAVIQKMLAKDVIQHFKHVH